MRQFTLIYEWRNQFEKVKRETSQFGVRQADKDGNSMYEGLVLDEENENLFTELFKAAEAHITAAASAYMRMLPDESVYIEDEDHTHKDITLTIMLPFDFNTAFTKSVSEAGSEYITAYIVYRWLETKNPEAAQIYLTRSESALEAFQIYLNKTLRLHNRPTAWY